MRKLALFLGLLLYSPFFFAQVDLSGWRIEVQDDTCQPVPAARVYINDSLIGITNAEGALNIALATTGPFQVKIEAEGYSEANIRYQKAPFGLAIGVTLERTGVLDDVVVIGSRSRQSADRSAVSVDVLKPYLIAERAQTEVKETLRQASGVHVADGSVNIRSGSGWSYGAGSRVLILLDEMPLISPDAGQGQWNLVPVEAISSIEVLKGAASSSYGTSAMNGIVNISTLSGTDDPHTDVRLYQGMYDSPKRAELKWWDGIRGWTGTQFNHTFSRGQQKQYRWVLAGQMEHDAGYQYDVPDHRARLMSKFAYLDPNHPNWTYQLTASGLWSETGDALLWNGYDQVYVPLDSQATRTKGVDFIVDPQVTFTGGGVHKLRGRFMVINNNAQSEETNYYNASRMGYAEYTWQQSIDKLQLLAGGNAQYGRSNSEIFGGTHNVAGQALFLQADYKLKWATVTAGLRYEGMQLDEKSWARPVVRLGANGGTESTRIRANFGQGYRFPSMAEMYTRTNVGALGVFPNTELSPESGWSAEIGVRQLFRLSSFKGYVDVAGFWMMYDQMMEFSFGKWGSGSANPFEDFGFRSINIGSTEIPGVELSTAFEYSLSEASKITFMGGLTWMEPRPLDADYVYASYEPLFPGQPDQILSYTSTSSNPESGVLKYRYQWLGKLDAQWEFHWFMIGASVRYNDYMQNIDGIFVQTPFDQFIPGIAESREHNTNGDVLIDLRIKAVLSEATSVSFIVNNLTNHEYYLRPALAGPMRSFALQLRYSI